MRTAGGFERGRWQRPPGPLFDDEAAAFPAEVYQRADAFLFGRCQLDIDTPRDRNAREPSAR
jgi:hypothetical protein